jgi:hypothetical protein
MQEIIPYGVKGAAKEVLDALEHGDLIKKFQVIIDDEALEEAEQEISSVMENLANNITINIHAKVAEAHDKAELAEAVRGALVTRATDVMAGVRTGIGSYLYDHFALPKSAPKKAEALDEEDFC